MTAPAVTLPSETPTDPSGLAPAGWAAMRGNGDLQFAPVTIPDIRPRQPSWLEAWLNDVFDLLGRLLAPLGEALGASWWWLQWALAALVAGFALLLAARMIAWRSGSQRQRAGAASADAWQPERAASLALLEDADRLASQGRFGEATRLLLQRSVSHIAAARPDWVEPSSTARELAALPALPDSARAAFAVIAERVERSLFALRALNREDWEAARAAYAEFALARLNERKAAA